MNWFARVNVARWEAHAVLWPEHHLALLQKLLKDKCEVISGEVDVAFFERDE
jgi:hypothetical protein